MATPERLERIREVLNRRQPDLTVLLDRVHKPHNLSAIARTCDAVGIQEMHAVSIESPHLDHAVNPLFFYKHSSAGAGKWLDLTLHKDLKEGIASLKGAGFGVWAADDATDAIPYTEVDFTAPFALVLGSERSGLDREALEEVDGLVSIPMMGMTRSLNVSVAAAILLFEARRQRQEAGLYSSRRVSQERYEALVQAWRERPKKGRAWRAPKP